MASHYTKRTLFTIAPCCDGAWARGRTWVRSKWRCPRCLDDLLRRALESLSPKFDEWARLASFLVPS